MQVDYLIIGQGISGTLLSRSLVKEGKKVTTSSQHAKYEVTTRTRFKCDVLGGPP